MRSVFLLLSSFHAVSRTKTGESYRGVIRDAPSTGELSGPVRTGQPHSGRWRHLGPDDAVAAAVATTVPRYPRKETTSVPVGLAELGQCAEKSLSHELPESVVGKLISSNNNPVLIMLQELLRTSQTDLGSGGFGSVKQVPMPQDFDNPDSKKVNVAVKMPKTQGRFASRTHSVEEGIRQAVAADRSKFVSPVKFVVTRGDSEGYIGMSAHEATFASRMAIGGVQDEEDVYFVVAQLGKAILDMHGTRTTKHRIAHHDLKPDNILLESNFQGIGAGMYVVDFGLARMDVDEKGNQSRALKPWKESYYTKVSYGTDSYKCPQLCWL